MIFLFCVSLFVTYCTYACTTLKQYESVVVDMNQFISIQQPTTFRSCAVNCFVNSNCTAFILKSNTCYISIITSNEIHKYRTWEVNKTKVDLYMLSQQSCRLFKSPSMISPLAPVILGLYDKLIPNDTLCDLYQPRGQIQLYTSFRGTKFDCIRECTYDSGCMAVFYQHNMCLKSTGIRLTDDSRYSSLFIGQAYVKKRTPIPYIQGYCSQYEVPYTCNLDDSCGWNKNRIGINQVKIVMLGYCGRVQCII
jgi:hypothetical protein